MGDGYFGGNWNYVFNVIEGEINMVWPLLIGITGVGFILWKGNESIETIGNETEDVINALIPLGILILIGYIIWKKV